MDNNINSIESVLGKILVKNKLTISSAESCTGGLLSGTLINYPGISAVFTQGFVTYSNEAKMELLGVKKDTLDKYGAVSPQTAEEMVIGLVNRTKTRIGISVTGIAGPDGGTDDKPVGLVYSGIYIDGKITIKKYNFNGDRQQVRNNTVQSILNLLVDELK